MTSFIDELISSDDVLAIANLESDLIVRDMLLQSAKDGSIETLRLAISRGQINTRTHQSIANAVVHVIGSDKSANRLTDKDLQRRLDFLDLWITAIAGNRPAASESSMDAWSKRTGPILASCFSAYLSSHDHVAGELIRLGVPADGKFFQTDVPSWTSVSGARLNTSELDESITLIAAAIKNRSRWVEEMASRHSLADPVVARIKVASIECNVNAASYALALGDAAVLRVVVSGLMKSKKNSKDDVALWMGDAIEHAEKLGLLDFGPDEVMQGITFLLASGAKLKNPSSFFSRLITLVDIPALANDPLATADQNSQIELAVKTHTYHLPSFVLHSPKSGEAVLALKAMASMGWNINQPIQPPSNIGEKPSSGMLPSHLAAFVGNIDAVKALKFLGGDILSQDVNGLSPIDYARIGSLISGRPFDLGFARVFESSYVPRLGDKLHFHDEIVVSDDFDRINEEAACASMSDASDQSRACINLDLNHHRLTPGEDEVNNLPKEGGYDYRSLDVVAREVDQSNLIKDDSSEKASTVKVMTEFEKLQKGQADRNRSFQKMNTQPRP